MPVRSDWRLGRGQYRRRGRGWRGASRTAGEDCHDEDSRYAHGWRPSVTPGRMTARRVGDIRSGIYGMARPYDPVPAAGLRWIGASG